MERLTHIAEYFNGSDQGAVDLRQCLEHAGAKRLRVSMIPGRCGSTLLASYCRKVGFGIGREIFNERPVERFANASHASSPQLFFSTVIRNYTVNEGLYFQIAPRRMEKLLDIIPIDDWVAAGIEVSLILRRDVFAQALSYYNAMQSGLWHHRPNTELSETGQDVLDAVDNAWIKKRIGSILLAETQCFEFTRLFQTHPKCVVFYEDLVADPFATMLRFLSAHRYDVEAARLQEAIESSNAVKKIVRPGAYRQYADMAANLPGFDALISSRFSNPLADSTYEAFKSYGY